jgi:hypothetical protein
VAKGEGMFYAEHLLTVSISVQTLYAHNSERVKVMSDIAEDEEYVPASSSDVSLQI